jgi:hypothetical protein
MRKILPIFFSIISAGFLAFCASEEGSIRDTDNESSVFDGSDTAGRDSSTKSVADGARTFDATLDATLDATSVATSDATLDATIDATSGQVIFIDASKRDAGLPQAFWDLFDYCQRKSGCLDRTLCETVCGEGTDGCRAECAPRWCYALGDERECEYSCCEHYVFDLAEDKIRCEEMCVKIWGEAGNDDAGW